VSEMTLMVAHTPQKCKEVDRLKAQISAVHAIFCDTVDSPTRTRYQTVKNSAMSLSSKIKRLLNVLKKKISEHQDLIKDIALERKEFEDLLKQTTLYFEFDVEDALRSEKARAKNIYILKTNELDDYIVTHSRQLKVTEAEFNELRDGRTSPFVSPILAPVTCPTTTH
jgi:hypothetical protein